jgi:hypothetical protein
MTFPEERDATIVDVIERSIIGHPRSQQERIGPSGLGDPCDRSLVYGLAGRRPPRRPYSGWKATVGTAGHAWMEAQFIAENERLGYQRFLTEQRVNVGSILGEPVPGTMDLYDVFEASVHDWKFVGPRMLKSYRSGGPGEKYRRQSFLYGAGMAALGHEVREVAIVFMPRDGELSSMWSWRAPFDQGVADETLDRANGLALRLRDEFGGDPDEASKAFEDCDEDFCEWCRGGRRNIPAPGSMFDALK